MTLISLLHGFAKHASGLGDVVKYVAVKANFTSAFRQAAQAGSEAPGTPRLMRLHSQQEGRAATFELGVDPSLRQRLDSLERAAARRRSPQLRPHPSDNAAPPHHDDMVVQKATVLAKDYRRAKGRGASGVKPEAGSGQAMKTSQQGLAPSPDKNVQRHTADVLRSLRSELATTVHFYGGSQRGDIARRLSNEVASALQKSGPDEALRLASQGIDTVRLASTRLVVKSIKPPGIHFDPGNRAADGRSNSERSQASSRSPSLPSMGSDSVFDEPDTANASGLAPTDTRISLGSSRSRTNIDYVRELRAIQKELFQMALKHPGSERGATARNLHSATQRTFEVVDAKTACDSANKLLPIIRAMSTSQGFG